jgi:Fe-S-cluster containining protein
MKEEQNICIKCGMCCDGIMFPYARLQTQESINPNYEFNIKNNEQKVFQLPCSYLKDKKCTIYQNRPYRVCDKFKCKLLRRYIAGDISFVDAVETIESVSKLRNKLLKAIADFNPSNTLSVLSKEFVSFEEHQIKQLGELEFRKKYGQTILDYRVLRMSLKKWFYREKI